MLLWKYKIAHIHIPKCAGTSLERLFFELDGLNPDWGKLSHDQKNKSMVGGVSDRQHSTQKDLESKLTSMGEDPGDCVLSQLLGTPSVER